MKRVARATGFGSRPSARREQHEENLQRSAIDLFDATVPPTEAYLFAVPNGGARDEITGAILKSMGVRAGVVDLVLLVKSAVWFIEVKRPGLGGRLETHLSKKQRDFRDVVTALSHPHRIFDSLFGFLEILHEAGVAKNVRMTPVGVPIVSGDTMLRHTPGLVPILAPTQPSRGKAASNEA